MRRLLLFLLVVNTGFGRLAFQTQAQSAPSQSSPAQEVESLPADSTNAIYDVNSVVVELQRLSDALGKKSSEKELAALRDSLPKQWTVKTPQNTFAISTEFLDKELAAGLSAPAKIWVDHLQEQVLSYSSQRTEKSVSARGELDKILAGAEFAGVRPPNKWDLFRQHVAAWLARMLFKLFSGIERYPIGGHILYWTIIALGVGLIGLWLIRFLESRDRLDSLPAGEIVSATRTWQEWVREAREAASRGDFREAVHSAYWAGIARLEDNGVVPKDRTKTPREYLRLVAEPSSHELAPRPVYHEPLTALTRRLERTWYANRGAGPEDFSDTLRQLEAMGCPLE